MLWYGNCFCFLNASKLESWFLFLGGNNYIVKQNEQKKNKTQKPVTRKTPSVLTVQGITSAREGVSLCQKEVGLGITMAKSIEK